MNNLIILIKLDGYNTNQRYLPYGLMYIANSLEKAGYKVKIFHNSEKSFLKEDMNKFLSYVKENKPLFTGFSVNTGRSTGFSAELSRKIKELDKDNIIVWGGVHPTIVPKQCLSEDYIDYVVLDEGEESIVELAEGIQGKREVKSIQGIGHNDWVNGFRPKIQDLDSCGIAWHLVDVNKYLSKYKDKRFDCKRVISYLTSRGCPFRCLAGDTIINTIEGDIPIKDLVGRKKVGVYTYDRIKKKVFITDAINIQKTGHKELVRVTFDDGTFIDCTPDHKFLTFKNGNQFVKLRETIKEAEDLKYKESVRAIKFYTNKYVIVNWGRRKRRNRSHLVMEYVIGRKLHKKERVHHKDQDKTNDNPNNLLLCKNAKEHYKNHPEISKRMKRNNPQKYCTKESYEKIREKITGIKRSLKSRIKYRKSKLGKKNPNYKGGISKYQNKKSRIKEINHKVVSVEPIGKGNVYNMEVPSTSWFFANNVLVHNCAFCYNRFRPENRILRYFSMKRVLSDINYLKEKYKIDGIWFNDDNFFVNRDRAFEIIAKVNLPWFGEARVDTLIDESFVKKLSITDCINVMSGAESGTNRVLKYINKEITKEQIIKATKNMAKYKVPLNYTFIVGFPNETWDEIIKTIKFIHQIEKIYPDPSLFLCRIGTYIPYLGSPLYDESIKLGFKPPVKTEDWKTLERLESTDNLPWIKGKNIKGLVRYVSAICSMKEKSKMGYNLFNIFYKWRLNKKYFKHSFEIDLLYFFVRKMDLIKKRFNRNVE